MTVVQPALTSFLISALSDKIYRGKVKLNGEYLNYDIYKTVEDGNILRKYLYLQTETGLVEEAQLLSEQNEILAIKPISIQKEEDGLVLAFEFKIVVQEG